VGHNSKEFGCQQMFLNDITDFDEVMSKSPAAFSHFAHEMKGINE